MPSARDVHQVVQTPDLLKALDMAIEMEAEAVAFYSGLASDITGFDNDILAGIVIEEKAHLSMLQKVRTLLPTSISDH